MQISGSLVANCVQMQRFFVPIQRQNTLVRRPQLRQRSGVQRLTLRARGEGGRVGEVEELSVWERSEADRK